MFPSVDSSLSILYIKRSHSRKGLAMVRMRKPFEHSTCDLLSFGLRPLEEDIPEESIRGGAEWAAYADVLIDNVRIAVIVRAIGGVEWMEGEICECEFGASGGSVRREQGK